MFSYLVTMSSWILRSLCLSYTDPHAVHTLQISMPYMMSVYYVTYDSPLHYIYDHHATYDTQSTRPYMINTLSMTSVHHAIYDYYTIHVTQLTISHMTPTYNALPIIPV